MDELQVICLKDHDFGPWHGGYFSYTDEDSRAKSLSDPRADYTTRECQKCGYRQTSVKTSGLLSDCEPLKPPGLDV